MSSRRPRAFRPALDGVLEGRVTPGTARIAPPELVDRGRASVVRVDPPLGLTPRAYVRAIAEIDAAFAGFSGTPLERPSSGGILDRLVPDFVTKLFSDEDREGGRATPGRGNFPLLASRLRAAVGRLPADRPDLLPSPDRDLDPRLLRPDNPGLDRARARFKLQVRRYLLVGLRDGRFAIVPTGGDSTRPSRPLFDETWRRDSPRFPSGPAASFLPLARSSN